MIRLFFAVLLSLTIFGCTVHEAKPYKFRKGSLVTVVVNGKKAIVVGCYFDNQYGIRYSNDVGELEYSNVEEYEIQDFVEPKE